MAHRKHVNSVCWGRAIAAALTFIAIIAPCSSYAFGKQEPTAIIVDAETGKPIEGVIALAQWLRGSDKGSWFEGGREVPRGQVSSHGRLGAGHQSDETDT